MPKPHLEWTVLPHGPLEHLGGDMMAVVGALQMPLVDLPRRMTVIRLRDGRLVIWSAVALDEPAMAQLEAFGPPAFLIVPSDHHRLDAAAWKSRYPAMQVVAPRGAVDKINEVVPVDTTEPDFGDPSLRFTTVAGTRGEEAALVVRRPGGTTLILNDIIGNIRDAAGFSGWLLRRLGLAGDEAQVPAVALLIVKDKQALGDQLTEWTRLRDLRRIVVSHGQIIEHEPRRVLISLARSLKPRNPFLP